MSTNDPMTQERLDAIQERVDTATRGPWAVDSDDPSYIIYPEKGGWDGLVIAHVAEQDGALFPVEHNGALIAHAPQDLTALLAEVERLRALTTVDDAMVERAAGTLFKQDFLERNPWADGARAQRSLEQARASTPRAWGQYLQVVRAALNAALGTGEDA